MKYTFYRPFLLSCAICNLLLTTPWHLPVAQAADTSSQTAAALYAQGVEDLYQGAYPEAQKAFDEIKLKHAYARFAPLAELRLADAAMLRHKYSEAIALYQSFLRFRPSHAHTHYARLQVAEAYFAQLPRDWLLLPPSAEKDQAGARAAELAYEAFLNQLPKAWRDSSASSSVAPAAVRLARQHLRHCRRKLADHEMYVAAFYLRREKFQAAAARAEGILHSYPELGLDAEALWIAGTARAHLGDALLAEDYLQRLIQQHPQHLQSQAARVLLKQMVKS